jgi:hypothetical protein
VLAYEYQGYGIAVAHCKENQKVVYKFLTEFMKVPLKCIILFDRSIGMWGGRGRKK